MPDLIPPHIRAIVNDKMSQPVSDPPTMREIWARMVIVEMLLDIYEEDPSAFPAGPLKDKWDMMLNAERVDLIAEGMAVLWP